jgi:hypothetical protein
MLTPLLFCSALGCAVGKRLNRQAGTRPRWRRCWPRSPVKPEPGGRTAWKSSLLKFLGEERALEVAEAVGAGPGDPAVLAVGDRRPVSLALGRLRPESRSGLTGAEGPFEFLWVIELPVYS